MDEKTCVVTVAEGVDKDNFLEQSPRLLSLMKHEDVGSLTFLDAWCSRMLRAAGLVPTMPKCVEDICYELGIVSATTIPSFGPKLVILNSARGAAVDPKAWNSAL